MGRKIDGRDNSTKRKQVGVLLEEYSDIFVNQSDDPLRVGPKQNVYLSSSQTKGLLGSWSF